MNLYVDKIFSVLTSVCFSPERLTHDAEGNGRNTSVPQKSRKSVWPDINLSTRESFRSSSFNLISQKTKKHDGRSVSSSSEKTFQYLKGFSVIVVF